MPTWTLNPITGVLITDRKGENKEDHMKTEAEAGVMQPQTVLTVIESWKSQRILQWEHGLTLISDL